ncbi:hypothetical protein PHLGIDRAFT_124541 [Phlebiopsis gigantea 11061_1 CR5-6]|uniref:Cytochrome P450 n=1 Tax=Phlebiopsis gigantea (strain 11061_1 CR5-6) TaxID=745531 RepID=A0A0C3P205_PHLG1|nr:hypothetical protein PHLGIDRAFT_124541 [Phlebiopsis gigantea 11061_1 CR5-6]
MSTLLGALQVTLAFAGIILIHATFKRAQQKSSLPPGPRGFPLIGNILDLPTSYEWLKFAEWEGKYGDIIHLDLLGQPVVVLNSARHAVALLDKRSNIYSDRPTLTMSGELVGWNRALALMSYGDRFREYRRFAARLFGGHAQIKNHHGLEEYETTRFLRRLLKDPDDVQAHIRKTAGAIILNLVYGYRVGEGTDPIVDLVETAVEQFSQATTPGAFYVDMFPLLRYVPNWVPGAGFQKKAMQWRRRAEEMADVPFELVKRRMMDHTNTPNYVLSLLESERLEGDKEFNIKWSAASIYSGGADTTVSAIYSFFLAMTLYPDVQKRAQAEIDSVVGHDRLPSFDDRPNLPYIEALVKEVLRWNPVGPLGLPHRLIRDDIYEGFVIPKGSIVMANIWKMLHDPSIYFNPSQFDPSRFLPDAGTAIPPDPREICFGFGRRICPGLHLADASVFISCAMTLATFDVSKIIENGKPVEPKVEYTTGTISHPKPFKCAIKPRSASAEALIMSAE